LGGATKAALQASQEGIADCLSPIAPSESPTGSIGPILFWLNLDSKAEVDELFAQWKAAHAKIVSEPEDKPWKLREFMAADLDGNL
jgi:uncharacterized glyoxalase superfamily protein PhnB